MTAQTLRNLIYYPHGPGNIESDMQAIAASPYYTNVVLGQFHLGETSGVLTWGSTPISQVTQEEWNAVQLLPQSGKIVSMQVGSAGNGTWKYIANNMTSAAETLVQALIDYPIVGIDLDPEPVGEVPLEVIYNFTLLLGGGAPFPYYLSHVPVPFDSVYFPQLYGSEYWPQMEPYINWITPQWYGETGSQLVTTYEQFVSSTSIAPSTVVAGQNSDDTTLSDLTSALESLGQKYQYNWGGVGIWEYPLPESDWAEEIYNALQPPA